VADPYAEPTAVTGGHVVIRGTAIRSPDRPPVFDVPDVIELVQRGTLIYPAGT